MGEVSSGVTRPFLSSLEDAGNPSILIWQVFFHCSCEVYGGFTSATFDFSIISRLKAAEAPPAPEVGADSEKVYYLLSIWVTLAIMVMVGAIICYTWGSKMTILVLGAVHNCQHFHLW